MDHIVEQAIARKQSNSDIISPSNSNSAFALTEVAVNNNVDPRNEQLPADDHQEIFITELMGLLNQDKLEELKKAFEQNDDEGLELAEFVHVMANIMRMDEKLYTPEQFAANLVEVSDVFDPPLTPAYLQPRLTPP